MLVQQAENLLKICQSKNTEKILSVEFEGQIMFFHTMLKQLQQLYSSRHEVSAPFLGKIKRFFEKP
jgi:hypothetical protein